MDNIYLIQLRMINMGNFKFTKTDIEGMFVVEPAVYGDNRGYFMETYSKKDFEDIKIEKDLAGIERIIYGKKL